MAFDPNPLFFKMASLFQENYKNDEKVIICNEGGSRSSKTWDTIHLIYAICDHNRNSGLDIYVLRDTLTKCRDFTLKDFQKCFKEIGDNTAYFITSPKPYCKLFGNNIYFRGLDDEANSEGYPSDILFLNESLEMKKSQVDGLKMRCRKLMILDWNPKFTEHWCFDLESQDNVFFTRTNYTNNKHLEKSIIKEIESYEPWESGTYYIENHKAMYKGQPISETNQPPVNQKNMDQFTADEFRWKVYGLGLRGAMKGLIFDRVEYIDEFPDLAFSFGLDFGFTVDPTALVRYAEEGNNIYLELLCYQPIGTPEDINSFFEAIDIKQNVPITADSSDKYTGENKGTVEMVSSLDELGWLISKVSKTKSIMFWIGSMKDKKIHIVKNHLYREAKKEQENYRFKEINGQAINQPIDKFNHFWDACFTENTLVKTITGDKKITEIKVGDRVLTSKGFNKVTHTHDNGAKETFEYCLQFDTFCLNLCSTKEHKVKTTIGWIEISKLKKGVTVYVTKCLMEKSISYTKNKGITQTKIERCIGMFGNTTTEIEKKALTYTIKMVTPLITLLETLKKFLAINTYLNTLKIGLKTILNGIRTFTQKELKLQRSGTKAKRVSSGISSMRKNKGLANKHTACTNAINVIKSSQRRQQHQDFALTPVSQNGEEKINSITRQEYAATVKKILAAADLAGQNAVLKCVVVKIDSKPNGIKNVYDISVEDNHEYFANGLLVHNCRYAHMSHNENGRVKIIW